MGTILQCLSKVHFSTKLKPHSHTRSITLYFSVRGITALTLTHTRKTHRTFRFRFGFVALIHRVKRVAGANLARILDAGHRIADLREGGDEV